MHHILWGCPALDAARGEHTSRIDRRGFPACDIGSWFRDRGLVGRSCLPELPARGNSGRWHVLYGSPEGIPGRIYTDGACRRIWYWPGSARSKWVSLSCQNEGMEAPNAQCMGRYLA
eukprot:2889629-Pyramimonas_sp.AAC.1